MSNCGFAGKLWSEGRGAAGRNEHAQLQRVHQAGGRRLPAPPERVILNELLITCIIVGNDDLIACIQSMQ